jgi:hypothetical protein
MVFLPHRRVPSRAAPEGVDRAPGAADLSWRATTVELAADLAVGAHLPEPEAAVQDKGGRVGKRHAGVGAVHVLACQGSEERRVELRADPATGVLGIEIDRRLDGGDVGALRAEAAGAGVAHDPPVEIRHDDPVAPARGVVPEPLATLLHRDRLEIEGDGGVPHVVVVDLVDGLEVRFLCGPGHGQGPLGQ